MTLLSLVTTFAVGVASSDCVFHLAGATFDLAALSKPTSYTAKDTYWRDARPFTYNFNICADVKSPATACEVYDSKIGAYQVEEVKDKDAKCMSLGTVESMHTELLDKKNSNAAVGIRLLYTNGTKCSSGELRSFAVNVYCAKEDSTLTPVSTVSEDLQTSCEYEVDIHSMWGCPKECHGTEHTKLCSGQGTCSIDSSLNEARCFCNDGWTGPECKLEDKGFTGASQGAVNRTLFVFVVLLLFALLTVSYVLFKKIKALNADDNPYGAFTDQQPTSAADM